MLFYGSGEKRQGCDCCSMLNEDGTGVHSKRNQMEAFEVNFYSKRGQLGSFEVNIDSEIDQINPFEVNFHAIRDQLK